MGWASFDWICKGKQGQFNPQKMVLGWDCMFCRWCKSLLLWKWIWGLGLFQLCHGHHRLFFWATQTGQFCSEITWWERWKPNLPEYKSMWVVIKVKGPKSPNEQQNHQLSSLSVKSGVWKTVGQHQMDPWNVPTQGRSSHPVPLEDWSTERKTCILPLLTCFFSVTTSWVFFGPVSCKTAALTGSTTFLGLETGRSINRSYQFLISLHTTVSFRVPKICLVGYLQELERLSSCCQRARSPLGEKHGQKGFIALFERCVFEKELFISWKYMVKLPNICSKCTWSHQSFPTRPLAANAGETSGFLGEFCSSQTKSCLLKGLAAGRV